MAKSRYDSRDYYNRESDGLKQRRLKEESRWKFNPNQDYSSNEDDDSDDEDFDDEYEQR
jgi:hypothetical protein